MQQTNQTGVQPVTTRSITQNPAIVPLEEPKHPALAHAGGVPLPSAPPVSGQPANPFERITLTLYAAGFIIRPGTVGGRFVVRTITREKANRHAA